TDIGSCRRMHMAFLQTQVSYRFALPQGALYQGSHNIQITVIYAALRHRLGTAVRITDIRVQIRAALALTGRHRILHRISYHAVFFSALTKKHSQLADHIPDKPLLRSRYGG